jgi:hypothetical protein
MTYIEETLHALKRSMFNDHTAVNQIKNPVATLLPDLSITQLQYIVGQYSTFPRCIVEFLEAARGAARKEGWESVGQELTRNMGEELGTETSGVPHYEMLIRGVSDATDPSAYAQLKNLPASQSTGAFLARVETAVRSADSTYALGAVYALESSAVPELIIVRDILTLYLKKVGGCGIEGTLKLFFDKHLGDWEPGHENGLFVTVPTYMTKGSVAAFAEGFGEVLSAMDVWWSELAKEASAIKA